MSGNKVEKSQKGVRGTAAFTEQLAKERFEWYSFQNWLERQDEDEFEITRINVRFPQDENGDYFVIVSAWVEGVQCVGFSSGITFLEALDVTLRRIKARAIKWKKDEYAE